MLKRGKGIKGAQRRTNPNHHPFAPWPVSVHCSTLNPCDSFPEGACIARSDIPPYQVPTREYNPVIMDTSGSSRRLAVLAGHLQGSSSSSSSRSDHILARHDTAATAVRSLPKFDPYIMETYLDDLREMKRQVYDLFKFKPELLPGPELSKGTPKATCLQQLRGLQLCYDLVNRPAIFTVAFCCRMRC
jgi:hypothetical protein